MTSSKSLIFLLALIVPVVFFAGKVFAATENISVSATVGDTPSSINQSGNSVQMDLPKTSVQFSGMAYPHALVTILKSGVQKSVVEADSQGYFSAVFEEDYEQDALYGLYATDVKGNRSLLINYPLAIHEGYLTHLSGIRFAPTINIDKSQVKAGDFLTVTGYAFSESKVNIIINGGVIPSIEASTSNTYTTSANKDGVYKIVIPLSGMSKGDYIIHAKYEDSERVSKLIRFVIADANIPSTELVMNLPGDCNADDVINLIDFSVLAFWYKRPNPPVCVDVNKDGIVNLIDFSVLAFYWTG